jgi:hypothetical protein
MNATPFGRVAAGIIFLSAASPCIAAEKIPLQLQTLIDGRTKAIERIDIKFVEELNKLKVSYTKAGDLESANLVAKIILETRPMDLVKGINLDGKWKVQTGTVANKVTREFRGDVLIDDTGARRPVERDGSTVTISWGPGWFERLVIDPDNPDVLQGQNHDGTKITYIRIR